MASLRCAGASLALALIGAGSAAADEMPRWRPLIEEASSRFGVPASWIERVIRAESRGATLWRGRPTTSKAGAMGLMQLMPGTWQDMRARLRLGANPHDPRDNILAGTFYLRLLYARFGYPGLFAAYNAGPARYADHLASGRSLPLETRSYVSQVTSASGSGARAGEVADKRAFGRSSEPSYGQIFFTLSSARSLTADTVRAVGAR
jgi:soluble lytic murein transglycosylase-like protein